MGRKNVTEVAGDLSAKRGNAASIDLATAPSRGALVSQKTLETMYPDIPGSQWEFLRWNGGGPNFYKVGGRRVLYDVDEVDAWLRSDKRASTSDSGNGEVA